MKLKVFLAVIAAVLVMDSVHAAYQYNNKGLQTWLTFDSTTTVAFDLYRSGKDKDHENFIDRGDGIADFGWYNMDTGATGSFANGMSATFTENDRIAFFVKDNAGTTYRTTRDGISKADEVFWGKSRIKDGGITIGGGNMGSNGTHEYYVFKVNNANSGNKNPSGQPLPGILATLVVGGGTLLYLKKRKKLMESK
ncbi:MAG: hypothetical protein IKB16_04635 [Lentisphaeria bacterium]|nr:hypothetical protein [Lentisphaeria bacterium]